jgi:hypothetical protein
LYIAKIHPKTAEKILENSKISNSVKNDTKAPSKEKAGKLVPTSWAYINNNQIRYSDNEGYSYRIYAYIGEEAYYIANAQSFETSGPKKLSIYFTYNPYLEEGPVKAALDSLFSKSNLIDKAKAAKKAVESNVVYLKGSANSEKNPNFTAFIKQIMDSLKNVNFTGVDAKALYHPIYMGDTNTLTGLEKTEL